MGLFDHIEYEANCPKCGFLLIDWQTKQGNNQFDTLQPYDVAKFYTVCVCKAYVICEVDAEVIRTVHVKKCEITMKALTYEEFDKRYI